MKPYNNDESNIRLTHPKKLEIGNNHLFFFQLAIVDGKICSLFLDDNVENVIGYTKSEIIHQEFTDLKLFDERYINFIFDTFSEAIKTPQHFEFETILMHKEGHLVLLKNKCVSYVKPYDNSREIMGFTEIISQLDIENYSKTSISKIINVAYNLGLVGTFYFDIKNNSFLWSDEVKKMHGYETEPSIEDYLKNVTAKGIVDVNHIIKRVIESKEGYQSIFKFYRKVDNTHRNILSIMSPIIDKNKNLIGISGNMIDLFDDSVNIEINNNSNQFDKVHPEKDSIFIKHLNQYIKINYNEILAISSLRDYVQIFTSNRETPYTYYSKLYKIKESLPEDIFVQTHRSHIINIQKIEKVADNNIFINDLKFPISRNYKAHLKNILK